MEKNLVFINDKCDTTSAWRMIAQLLRVALALTSTDAMELDIMAYHQAGAHGQGSIGEPLAFHCAQLQHCSRQACPGSRPVALGWRVHTLGQASWAKVKGLGGKDGNVLDT